MKLDIVCSNFLAAYYVSVTGCNGMLATVTSAHTHTNAHINVCPVHV